MRIPIAKEGYPFIFIALVPVVVAWIACYYWFELLFLPIFLFVLQFFRDPERDLPSDPNAIVSPADGVVIKIDQLMDTRFTGAETRRICIFMNVVNVHVNRNPASGTVKKVVYNHGKFFNASFDKASLENEQNAIVLDTGRGTIVYNQIAGLIARRIVCYLKGGEIVERGARFGMIRFGSRVDVYLPLNCEVAVNVGDKVSACSSTIARFV